MRMLTEKGKKTQTRMAEFFEKKGWRVLGIFTSPAARARQSGLQISDHFRAPTDWDLCLLNPIAEVRLLQKLPDPNDNVCYVVIGHDPSITLFANRMCGEEVVHGGMEKSAAVVLEVTENAVGTAKFIGYFTPRDAEKELGASS